MTNVGSFSIFKLRTTTNQRGSSMLTNQQIIDTFNEFNKTGYSAKFLSYNDDSNISLGEFRNYMLNKNANSLDLTKKSGNYVGFRIEDINDFIKRTQKEYYNFCCSNGLRYKNQEDEIIHWYRGIIGEWFIVRILLKEFSQVSITDHKTSLYKFSYPIPSQLISKEKYEFGTDCIAIGPNNKPVVFQIKFWHLYTDQKITYSDIIANLHNDATENEYIELHQPESMWIVWTGLKEKDVSMWIKKTPNYKHNMIKYIDRNDMNRVIENNANMQSMWKTEISLWK